MYKCGWNGCEKAYGTLNHLNAHVTMQGHGPKRTPDGMASSPPHTSGIRQYRLWCWAFCGGRIHSHTGWQSWVKDRRLTTRTRIQRDPKGMEAAQEGGGGPAKG